ncbi:hypothetical protein TCAL_03935 [Tigriopus californicus]|uniref:Alanine--glyoxylate aminotransferase 2-like n=1 Tax=Tigriopus californicus TaxID=6832 RepID=A0A553P2T6_TIGCA|nr:hypothetical protein TCAL_03935 [Tigriopus californicus]
MSQSYENAYDDSIDEVMPTCSSDTGFGPTHQNPTFLAHLRGLRKISVVPSEVRVQAMDTNSGSGSEESANARLNNRSIHVLPANVNTHTLHLQPMGSMEPISPLPNIDSLHTLPTGAPIYAKSLLTKYKKAPLVLSTANDSPIKLSRASKQYLYDETGQEFLDCINGTAHVGHCHPQVVSAGQVQMSRLTTAQGFLSEVLSKYVKELVDTLPERLSVCYLCNSGSEANDLAIRLARQYTQSDDIIANEGAYHGNLGVLVDISPKINKSIPQYRNKEWSHTVPVPKFYNGKHDLADGETTADLVKKHVQDFEDCLKTICVQKGRRIAAFIFEPMFAIPGVHIPPKEYFQEVFRLVRQYGGICIADEVQSGLGRTGENFWGFQNYDVFPDVVTVGKPLGNGHPMAAVICTKEVSDRLGGYFSTFGGNPVSCSVGLAVLDVISNEKLMSSAKRVGRLHGMALKDIMRKYPNMVGDVRGMGLMWGIEIVAEQASKAPCPELARNIMFGLKARKILVGITGDHRNILLFTPPMCFTVDNSRRFCQSLDDVLNECLTSFNIQSLSLQLQSDGRNFLLDDVLDPQGSKGQSRKRLASNDPEEDSVKSENEDLIEDLDDKIDSKRAKMELEEYEDLD